MAKDLSSDEVWSDQKENGEKRNPIFSLDLSRLDLDPSARSRKRSSVIIKWEIVCKDFSEKKNIFLSPSVMASLDFIQC